MAITQFRGVKQAEDWSGVANAINEGASKYSEQARQEQARQRKQRAEDEAKYLSDARKDPVYTASAYWQQDQAKKMQELQTHVGEIYRNAKEYYHPDLEGRLDIQNHLAAFNMYQQKIKGGMTSYEQAYKKIESDPNGIKYDHAHFAQRVNEWMDPKGDGELGEDLLLPPKIGDRAGWWLHKDNKSAGEDITVTDNNGIRTTVTKPMEDPEKQRQYHKEWVFNPKNAGYVRTMMEDWAEEKPEIKKKYLENDGDERSAILDWDFDTAGKNAFGEKKKTTPSPPALQFANDKLNKIQATPSTSEDEFPITIDRYETKPYKPRKDNKGNYVIDPKTGKPEDENAYWNATYGGKKQMAYIKSEGTVYSFAPGTVGTLHLSQKYNKETGKIEKTKPNTDDLQVSNIDIKYYPVNSKGDMVFHRTYDGKSDKYYLDKNGKVKEGYKLRAVGETKDGERFPITEESKGLLKAKFPNNVHKIKTSQGNVVNIDDIPLEISQGEQDPDYKETPKATKSTPKSKELKVTNAQIEEAAKKNNLSVDEYKKRLIKLGHKLTITK
jgi:hypothetical protein